MMQEGAVERFGRAQIHTPDQSRRKLTPTPSETDVDSASASERARLRSLAGVAVSYLRVQRARE